jgi:hypothetical protein
MNKFIKVDISVIFISFGFTKVVIFARFAKIPFMKVDTGLEGSV